MFRVEAKRRVLKALTKLSIKRKSRIKEVISILKNDPIPFRRLDVAKLKGMRTHTALESEASE
jgi:mRNA-degrading endonuclease RelE of RelBE toxin-antitoxin system